MPTNVEIKARVRDPEILRKKVENLSDTPGELLVQEDVFYDAPGGRLKLRQLPPDRGELIHYQREDLSGPKLSRYLIYRTSDPEALRTVLGASLTVRGVVRKRRWLYMAGPTRIHLDDVEGLGAFMELEVVLQTGQSAEEGQRIAEDLMQRLGVDRSDLVEGAYVDLLRAIDPDAGPD